MVSLQVSHLTPYLKLEVLRLWNPNSDMVFEGGSDPSRSCNTGRSWPYGGSLVEFGLQVASVHPPWIDQGFAVGSHPSHSPCSKSFPLTPKASVAILAEVAESKPSPPCFASPGQTCPVCCLRLGGVEADSLRCWCQLHHEAKLAGESKVGWVRA